MTQDKKLIGVINKLTGSEIHTRFFYLNNETGEVKDVSFELCLAIRRYNDVAEDIRSNGKYSMKIPYDYNYGMAIYGFGCGLSHYLQENEFEEIENRAALFGNTLSFPLKECRLTMFTPNDVKHILKCKGVFDDGIMESLKERYALTSSI